MTTPLKLFLGAFIGAHCMTAAAISFDVTFDDPSGRYTPYYSNIISHTNAAGDAWNRYLGSDANLDVQISFSDIPTAAGNSATSAYVGVNGTSFVYEQGAAAQVRTGSDPNGNAPDIYINFGSNYLLNDLWFDPNPYQRDALVPTDKIDAASVIQHEFGHALAFNGWRDPVDGSLPGNYLSTFDKLVIADGDNLFFTGSLAVQEYGGYVPLTFGNYTHLGNRDPMPGEDLISDLMNGVALNYGDRAFISDLDIAILADTGVITLPSLGVTVDSLAGGPGTGGLLIAAPVNAVPLPAAAWLFGSGLCGLMGLSRSKKSRPTG